MKGLLFGASIAALSMMSAPAVAQDWFVEGSAGLSSLWGNSSTTNGGQAFGGGGAVWDVEAEVGQRFSIAGGRALTEHWSLALSYQHYESDISYSARYAVAPTVPSYFEGEARSDVLMLEARYTTPISPKWSLTGAAGMGVARNTLRNVTEVGPDRSMGWLYQLGAGETDEFAWQVSGRVAYAATSNVSVFGEIGYVDLGEFWTAGWRSLYVAGAPGVAITPYEVSLDGPVLSAGLQYRF